MPVNYYSLAEDFWKGRESTVVGMVFDEEYSKNEKDFMRDFYFRYLTNFGPYETVLLLPSGIGRESGWHLLDKSTKIDHVDLVSKHLGVIKDRQILGTEKPGELINQDLRYFAPERSYDLVVINFGLSVLLQEDITRLI